MDTFAKKLEETMASLLSAEVFCGHGYESVHDEAVALVLGAAALPPGQTESLLVEGFPEAIEPRLQQIVSARCVERMPVAYVLGEAWLAGLRFKADRRALVPRSPIAHVLAEGCEPWLLDGLEPRTILDLCCGGGSLGIIAAHAFPASKVVLSDLDAQALTLAQENVALHGLEGRVSVAQADLVAALADGSIDLLVANPPYVSADEMTELPAEYAHEPRWALEAPEEGTALAVEVMRGAARVLSERGLLIFEVGETFRVLEQHLPRVPFTWIDLPEGGAGVAVASAQELRDWSATGIL